MWKCINCGANRSERPNFCNNCGLVQAGVGTQEKYDILRDYCHPLSLIMRNQNLDHYFIDACAGSGQVQAYHSNDYIDGSPVIMAKTHESVENIIKDKTKPKHVKCIFIEVNPKTYQLLNQAVQTYPNCELKRGDCNRLLPEVLDKIESEQARWTPFCFIYIDPFGLGDPPISMSTLERILERGYTELLLHINIDALIRVAGWLRHLDSPDVRKKKQARSYRDTLRIVLGDQRIDEFCANWSRWPRGMKEARSLEYYLSGLEGYYPHIEHIGIPIGSDRPVYYLVFTTRKDTGYKIMNGIMQKARRRGAESLDKWFKKRI